MKDLSELRIVLADDHAFLLQGLKDYLASKRLQIVGQAEDGTKALQLIMDEAPDIAILDIEMPYLSGFSIAEICKQKGLPTKIIILSFHKEADFVTQAKRLGISGYILKEDATNEILDCITSVAKGQTYFSKAVQTEKNADTGLGQISELTPSERKILRLVAQKNSTEEIAEQLYISIRTVEKHRSNIVAKLGLSGQSNSLTTWAIENKALLNNL